MPCCWGPGRRPEIDHLAQAKTSWNAACWLKPKPRLVKPSPRTRIRQARHYFLGYVLFRQTKARDRWPSTPGAKYRRQDAADLRIVGSDYVLLGGYGDADKWFTKAAELEPNNVLGWYYLGRTKYNEIGLRKR